MKKILVTALLFLLGCPVLALAQPACTTGVNTPACQSQATNLQGSDILFGQQAIGPQRQNQTVKISINQLGPEIGSVGASQISGQFSLTNLPTIASNTVLGNATGGATTPYSLSIPACVAQGEALGFTAGAGFGCNSGFLTSGASIPNYLANVQTNATASCTLTASGSGGCSGQTGGDCGAFLRFTGSSAVTITVPNTLPVGCQVAVEQDGTAKVSFSAASGATIHSSHNFTGTSAQYAVIGLTIVANAGGTAAEGIFTGDGS